MNLFVIMMLLNMALVWLMMYSSICLMIIVLKCSMIIVSREYFEITFISRKKGLCWPSFRDYLLFDIRSAQSAIRFLMLIGLICYMTIVCKWAGQNFCPQKYFRQKKLRYFIDENAPIITIFVHSFLRKAWSLSLRWNIFLKKGDGLLCQILMILQC